MTKTPTRSTPTWRTSRSTMTRSIALAGVDRLRSAAGSMRDNIAVNGLTLQYTDATSANFAARGQRRRQLHPAAGGQLFRRAGAGSHGGRGLTYGSSDGISGIVPDGALGPALYPGANASCLHRRQRQRAVSRRPTGWCPDGPGDHRRRGAGADDERAQSSPIRRARRSAFRLNSSAQVTVTIVDLDGNVLAQARTPDAPIFGADVSRQKARTAVFFSRTDAAATDQRDHGPRQHRDRDVLPTTSADRKASSTPAFSPTGSPGPNWRSAISRGRFIPTASTATRRAR